MKYQVYPPAPQLAKYVKFFWSLEAELEPFQNFPHRLFADACPTMVVHWQGTFSKVQPGHGSFDYPLTLLHGHTSDFTDMTVNGSFGIFGIYFYPWAVGPLFNVSLKEIVNAFVTLPELLGEVGKELQQRLLTAEDNQHRILISTDYLSTLVSRIGSQDQLIQACLMELMGRNGGCTVDHLSELSGWSIRHLERRFKGYTGFSPKLFARILRFQNSLAQYERGNYKTLTDLAYGAGFYDQSHLIREFKAFSGIPPRKYFNNSPEIAEGFVRLA